MKSKKQIIIFTLIYDPNQMFQLWLNWYLKFFSSDEILVLNLSNQPLNFPCQVKNFTQEELQNFQARRKEGSYNQLVNETKGALLQDYQYVIYTDYDELLFYPGGLRTILEKNPKYLNPRGYEIIQNRETEESLDFSKSIFHQRRFWVRNPYFDKPLVTSIDFRWSNGYHSAYIPVKTKSGRTDNCILKPKYLPDFCLLHLHRIDYDFNLRLNQRNLDVQRVVPSGADCNLLVGQDFENWWKPMEVKVVPIPDIVSQALQDLQISTT